MYFIILKSPSSLLVSIETQVLGKRFELPSVFIAPIPCAEPPNHSTQCKNRNGSGPKDWDAYGTEVLWGVCSLSLVVACVVEIFDYLQKGIIGTSNIFTYIK